MARFKDRRGWEWTREERAVRQQAVRRAQAQLHKLREQARRIAAHLPQFAAQADQAARHLEAGLGRVAGLNLSSRGPKYQPVAPDEADRVLATVPELLRPWREFAASPAFAAAARQKNREIRAHNAEVREHNRAVAAREAATWEVMRQVMERMDQGDIGGALDRAAKHGLL